MHSSLALPLLCLAAFSPLTTALNPIVVMGQDFVDSGTGDRFEIIGVDYQPGGSSGFTATGPDPLSDANAAACLRDAAIMQTLGVNTIRVYNLNAYISHNQCASIFNQAGIYMLLDVNSPLVGQSIDQLDPSSTYGAAYLNRTFAILDAFREYPNTLGFFSANELINNDATAAIDPPYIRAVTRDLKQYMAARGGRQIPIGYAAADVRDVLVATSNYVQCTIGGNTAAADIASGRSDFFALNSYSWCGASNFVASTYNQLAADFANTTIPVFFGEYGCNLVEPRTFTDVPSLYGLNMTTWSGGLVYEWTQEGNNYGLLTVNSDGSVTLGQDFANLKTAWATIDLTITESYNASGSGLTPPVCSAGLITYASFQANYTLPPQPSGVASLISSGAPGAITGTIVSVTSTVIAHAVTPVSGAVTSALTLTSKAVANVPSGATGSATATAAVTVSSAAASVAGSTGMATATATKKSGAADPVVVGGNNAAFGFGMATLLMYLLG